jgi:hypothetical protein
MSDDEMSAEGSRAHFTVKQSKKSARCADFLLFLPKRIDFFYFI